MAAITVTPITIPAITRPAITASTVWIGNLQVLANDPNRPVAVKATTFVIGTDANNKQVIAPGTTKAITIPDYFKECAALTTDQNTAVTTLLAGASAGQKMALAFEFLAAAIATKVV